MPSPEAGIVTVEVCPLCRLPLKNPDRSVCEKCVPPDESEIKLRIRHDALRQALTRLGSYAATCMVENTPEWMQGLVGHLNQSCETLGIATRFKFCIPARPGYRGDIRKVCDA